MNKKEILSIKSLKISDSFKFYDSPHASTGNTEKDFYELIKYYWIKLCFRWRFFGKTLSYKSENEESYSVFRLINGTCSIPHHKKVKTGGDDFHYVNDRLLVVADGVGGWKNYNINPGEYSKELCQQINENFHQYELFLKIREKYWKQDEKTMSDSKSDALYDIDMLMSEKIAKKLLIKSANLTKSKGSSTCTILMLDKSNGKVFSSYIGDSCYMILRYDSNRGKFYNHFISEEQMHSQLFNTPYQIGNKGDNPEKAITNTHELKNNDLIILASDGLWDNIEISRIIQIINETYIYLSSINPKELAFALAEEAKKNSNNKKFKSPFAKRAKRFYNFDVFSGGKPDDITIIVSQLTNKDKLYYDSSTNTSTTDNNDKNEDPLEFN